MNEEKAPRATVPKASCEHACSNPLPALLARKSLRFLAPEVVPTSFCFRILALQPEQQVREPLRIRKSDQMAAPTRLRVYLQAIAGDALLELKRERSDHLLRRRRDGYRRPASEGAALPKNRFRLPTLIGRAAAQDRLRILAHSAEVALINGRRTEALAHIGGTKSDCGRLRPPPTFLSYGQSSRSFFPSPGRQSDKPLDGRADEAGPSLFGNLTRPASQRSSGSCLAPGPTIRVSP